MSETGKSTSEKTKIWHSHRKEEFFPTQQCRRFDSTPNIREVTGDWNLTIFVKFPSKSWNMDFAKSVPQESTSKCSFSALRNTPEHRFWDPAVLAQSFPTHKKLSKSVQWVQHYVLERIATARNGFCKIHVSRFKWKCNGPQKGDLTKMIKFQSPITSRIFGVE